MTWPILTPGEWVLCGFLLISLESLIAAFVKDWREIREQKKERKKRWRDLLNRQG